MIWNKIFKRKLAERKRRIAAMKKRAAMRKMALKNKKSC